MPLNWKNRRLHENHVFLAKYYSDIAKSFPELQNHAALATMANLAQHAQNPEELDPVFQVALRSFRKDLSRITVAQQALWCAENHAKCELEGAFARGGLVTGKLVGGTVDGMVGMLGHVSMRYNQTREAIDVPVLGDTIGLVGAAAGFVEALAVGGYHLATEVVPSVATAAKDSVMHPEYSNMQLADEWATATLNVQGVIGIFKGTTAAVPKVRTAAQHMNATIKGAAEAVRNNMDNSGGLVPVMGTAQDSAHAVAATKALPPLDSGLVGPLVALALATTQPPATAAAGAAAPRKFTKDEIAALQQFSIDYGLFAASIRQMLDLIEEKLQYVHHKERYPLKTFLGDVQQLGRQFQEPAGSYFFFRDMDIFGHIKFQLELGEKATWLQIAARDLASLQERARALGMSEQLQPLFDTADLFMQEGSQFTDRAGAVAREIEAYLNKPSNLTSEMQASWVQYRNFVSGRSGKIVNGSFNSYGSGEPYMQSPSE